MILVFGLASFLFVQSQAYQGEDMSDDDFAAFVGGHQNIKDRYLEPAGRGCVNGAVGGMPGGFKALCLGCVSGAAANVVEEGVFGENKNKPHDFGYFNNERR